FFEVFLRRVLRETYGFRQDEEQPEPTEPTHGSSDAPRVYSNHLRLLNRMRRHSRIAAAILCATCIVVNVPPSASQTRSMEYQVKATFLYNFAQFIQWPSQVFPDPSTPFTICIAGDPFDGALEKTIGGEMLNGRRIIVRRLATGDNLQGCHIVYVS